LDVERVETGRYPSPGRRVDAVVVRGNAGATTSFSYSVHIVPAGKQPDEYTEVLRADHVNPKELKIQWNGERTLMLDVGNGRVFQFRNFWDSREVDKFFYIVQIILKASAEERPVWASPDPPR
jgi:hypothetical protein